MKITAEKDNHTTQPAAKPAEYVSPEVNIYETNEGYVLEAEMPGVNKSGLEVTLEDNELTIVGHRQTGLVKSEALFRESNDFGYRRVFQLDPAVDTTKISAKVDQGILTLTLPKSEKVKPRKISVD